MTLLDIAAQALGSIDHIGSLAQTATTDAVHNATSALSNLGSVSLEDEVGGSCICTHIFHF